MHNPPIDFKIIHKNIYMPHGLACTSFTPAIEGNDYNASHCYINGKSVQYRTAKKTPKKIGYFVTMWKRNLQGNPIPYDSYDTIDIFIITVADDTKWGQFIFPKNILVEKGFFSHNGKGGKRAMRVYPSWSKPENAHAQKAQDWQILYFFDIKPLRDEKKIKQLFTSLLAF